MTYCLTVTATERPITRRRMYTSYAVHVILYTVQSFNFFSFELSVLYMFCDTFRRVATQNIISYQACNILTDRFCPQNVYATIQSDDIYEYMQFDWSVRYDNATNTNVTKITNRGYTLKVYANNSEYDPSR